MKGFFSFLIGKLMVKCSLMTGRGLLFGNKWNKDTSEHRDIRYPKGFSSLFSNIVVLFSGYT